MPPPPLAPTQWPLTTEPAAAEQPGPALPWLASVPTIPS
jgi:hypothetical protein